MAVSATAPFSPMPPAPPSGVWTYEDYAAIPDDGHRYEVLGGRLIRLHGMSPAPRIQHQEVVGAVYAALRSHVRARGAGLALVAPVDVVLAEERLGIIGDTKCEGPPDLVVEVLSESTRRKDVGEKREAYAAAGVREYWIIDPAARAVDVLSLRTGRSYERVLELDMRSDQLLTSPLLPGFSLALADLFG